MELLRDIKGPRFILKFMERKGISSNSWYKQQNQTESQIQWNEVLHFLWLIYILLTAVPNLQQRIERVTTPSVNDARNYTNAGTTPGGSGVMNKSFQGSHEALMMEMEENDIHQQAKT